MAFVSRLGVPCRQSLGVIINLTGMGTVYSIGGYPRKPVQERGLCLTAVVIRIDKSFDNSKTMCLPSRGKTRVKFSSACIWLLMAIARLKNNQEDSNLTCQELK